MQIFVIELTTLSFFFPFFSVQPEANFDPEPNLSSNNIFVNRISPEESNSDKMENFLETIPEAENSMANTLDRLGDRQSINSEESCCIPSRRTSPDGSCDNSLNNSNYANRNQILAQPIVVKSQFSDNFKLGALDEDLKGSKETLSGDEINEDRCSELINLNQLKNVDEVKMKNNSVKTCFESKYDHACNNFYSPSPELPRSLTSSCNNLCDNDGDVSNYENEEEELNFDDNLLANRSAVFSSNQSELSDEDEEDPYCLLKEGAKRMEPDTISDGLFLFFVHKKMYYEIVWDRVLSYLPFYSLRETYWEDYFTKKIIFLEN